MPDLLIFTILSLLSLLSAVASVQQPQMEILQKKAYKSHDNTSLQEVKEMTPEMM